MSRLDELKTELAKVFHGAFPDIQQTIEDAVADDEKAAVRFSATGTHKGELMGMPPTGKAEPDVI